MSVLGLNFETKSLRYAALDGTKEKPTLTEKDRLVINAATSIPDLMGWYESSFINLINKFSPEIISCKLNLEAKKAQIPYWHYPLGILHSIALKKGIPVKEYVAQNFTPSRLDLPKTTNIFGHVDQTFGNNPPYWDKNQKYAVLAAWLELS